MKVLPMMSEHCIRDQNMAEFLDIVSESELMVRNWPCAVQIMAAPMPRIPEAAYSKRFFR